MSDQDISREGLGDAREAIAEQGDGRVGSIIRPESRVLSTGVLDGSRADRDIPRFGADEAGPF